MTRQQKESPGVKLLEEMPSVHRTDRQLDRSLVSGIAWTGSLKWVVQGFSWLGTLIVARLLAPEDYGLIGMATVYLGMARIIAEGGLCTAVVAQQDFDETELAQLNAFSVLLGSVIFLLSCAAASPLASFFKVPQLKWVVVVMSTTFVISSFQTVPSALLQRGLRFKKIALVEGLQAAIQLVSTILLALWGLGYWSLVLAGVLGTMISAVAMILCHPCSFAWPQPHAIRGTLMRSMHLLLGTLSWYCYTNSDFLVAGRFLGMQALGAYTLAWTLANQPVEKISALVGRVTPAFFSAVQSDLAGLRRYLLRITEALAMITIPCCFGLAVVAEEFVLLALGDKWRSAIIPLQLLAAWASFRSVVTLIPQVMIVIGETRFGMWNTHVMAIVMPFLFYLGSHWGTSGVAAVWILAQPVLIYPSYRRVFQKIELGAREYLWSVWPALSSSLGMVGVVLLAKAAVDVLAWPLAARLCVQVAAGAIAFLLCLRVFHRDRLIATRSFLVRLRP